MLKVGSEGNSFINLLNSDINECNILNIKLCF